MQLYAEQRIYWPGINKDIKEARMNCLSCTESAPSLPNLPPWPTTAPKYPFQMICMDMCHLAGRRYGVMVDRYSNFPMIWEAEKHECSDILHQVCSQFGIPEVLTSDGGLEFSSRKMKDMLESYGIQHRISSAYNPHANCRAEVAVKSMKRLMMDNISSDGSLKNARMLAALNQYRNTPDRDMMRSPAEMVFGRPMRDMLPISEDGLLMELDSPWRTPLMKREVALKDRSERDKTKWSEKTRTPGPLAVDDTVAMQNMHGNMPQKWSRRGQVISNDGFDKFGIRLEGSRQLTYRNRKHLRKIPAASNGRTGWEPVLEYPGKEKNDVETTPVVTELAAPEPVSLEPVSPEPVRPETVIPVPVSPEPVVPEPEAPEPPSTTSPAPERSRPRRTNAGKTSKYNDYICTMVASASQDGTARGAAPVGGGA